MLLMNLDERVVLATAAVLYSAAVVGALLSLLQGRRYAHVIVLGLVGGGFVVQTVGLYLRGIAQGSCPLSNLFEWVQFVAWSSILLYFVIGAAFRRSLLGFFSAGLAALLTAIAFVFPSWDASVAGGGAVQAWVEAHAAFALFSYGTFGLLAVTAGMYLLQAYGLQHKRLGGLFRLLPSIVEMDRMNQRLLLVGLIGLSGSILIAVVYGWDQLGGLAWNKFVATVFVGLSAFGLMALRLARLLLTQKFAWCCIGLFCLALFSLVAV